MLCLLSRLCLEGQSTLLDQSQYGSMNAWHGYVRITFHPLIIIHHRHFPLQSQSQTGQTQIHSHLPPVHHQAVLPLFP